MTAAALFVHTWAVVPSVWLLPYLTLALGPVALLTPIFELDIVLSVPSHKDSLVVRICISILFERVFRLGHCISILFKGASRLDPLHDLGHDSRAHISSIGRFT